MTFPLGTAGQVVGTNAGATALTNLTGFVQGASGANGIITGTNTNDNAAAGKVGEYISSSVAFNAVSVTTATPTNIGSISLTAGDWHVGGNIVFNAAGTTSVTDLQASISTTSATQGGLSSRSGWTGTATLFADLFGITCPTQRLSLSGTTIVYIVGYAAFTVSTMTAGGNIWGLRVR